MIKTANKIMKDIAELVAKEFNWDYEKWPKNSINWNTLIEHLAWQIHILCTLL